jgi:DNA polymerase III epsilon subunit-like protein
MFPDLPAAHVRAAIDADDWGLANRLLGEHHRALSDALAQADLSHESIAPWRDLLLAQHALQDELRVARDRAGHALDKLNHDQRGARAWLRELA